MKNNHTYNLTMFMHLITILHDAGTASLSSYFHVCGSKNVVQYRIAGNFRGANISRISRMGSNSRTLKSPKLISSLKVGVVYLLARVASQV